ncbi:DUF3187 family protein [Acanthopleuribacter pedis]|uniref:DUF3187 family protein n=1 Tax=Acanthopleuribacter pedis TaxID=442870 RepID=A0A8J7QDH1_9BACT|nr:DUF3187 family protein [Acanthopleuribacter pedis]MBO1317063.1 DUF3187 family protein [Acanthopleuribacter pedis]
MNHLIVCALVSLLLLVPTPLPAGEPLGPFHIRERNPVYQRFLSPRVDTAAVLSAGTSRFSLGNTYTNVFERESNEGFVQNIDFELWTFHLERGYGFGRGWEISTEWRYHETRGGFLDHFIQEYHGLLNLPNDNREDVPNNTYSFFLGPSVGPALIDFRDPVGGFSDPVITLKKQIRKGPRLTVAASLQIKPPWGADNWSSGETDAGLNLLVQRRGRKHHLHLQAAWVSIGRPEAWRAVQNGGFPFLSVALERNTGEKSSLLAQLDWGGSPFQNTGLENLEDDSVNFTVGWRRHWGKDWQAQISFAEDLTGDGPAVDFSLDIQIAKKFNF